MLQVLKNTCIRELWQRTFVLLQSSITGDRLAIPVFSYAVNIFRNTPGQLNCTFHHLYWSDLHWQCWVFKLPWIKPTAHTKVPGTTLTSLRCARDPHSAFRSKTYGRLFCWGDNWRHEDTLEHVINSSQFRERPGIRAQVPVFGVSPHPGLTWHNCEVTIHLYKIIFVLYLLQIHWMFISFFFFNYCQ